MMATHPIEAFTPKRQSSPGTSATLSRSRRGEESGGMRTTPRTNEADRGRRPEREIAQEILSFLPEGSWALDLDDGGMLRYTIRLKPHDWKLEMVLFSKPCLARLDGDPLRAVKIGYLQRDIQNLAASRRTYAYPHSALSQLTGS